MAAPLNQAWEWPVDGHTQPINTTATNHGNTPGDITPTQHRKLQGKFSHPTTSTLALPGPLARPQSTPCIPEVANKPVKLKKKLSNLLTSTHRTSSVDSHLTSHVTQMVGMNLLLLLPKQAEMNPDLFTGVERQDSSQSPITPVTGDEEFVISTKGSSSTSTLTSSRDDSPFRTPSPLVHSSSPRRSRETSPMFIPQKIPSVPSETRRDSHIILFRPPSTRKSISRENAFDFDLEDVQPEINVTESPAVERVRHTNALHRIHLTRSISESELLWIKESQKMRKGDSADDVVSIGGRRKGSKGFFGFHSKPPSRELSEESIGDPEKEKKGLFRFWSHKGSKIKNQKKSPAENRGNFTIPVSRVCDAGKPTCPLPPTSATMPVDQATAAVKGYGTKKTESPTLIPKKNKLKLHNPRNTDTLVRDIYLRKYDMLGKDENEDLPLHAIVRSNRRDKLELMIALLVHSDFGCGDIDLPALYGNTALHLAVMKADIIAVKTLLAFGADINAINRHQQTPYDLLPEAEQKSQLSTLLESFHAKTGSRVGKKEVNRLPRLASYSANYPELQEPHLSLSESLKLVDFEEGKSLISLAQKLEFNLNILYRQVDLLDNPDTEYAIGIQQFELQRWRTTSSSPIQFEVQGGSRLLFLDGGGIKGLVQIEILARLEQLTGRRIVDLFDWIIGCSTGGIVALALVYAKKTLPEMRQLYFKLKEQIFASPRFGFAYNTEALESLLKETLGSEIRMCDVREPKVLVAAVNKKTTKLELKFFNNCFEYPDAPQRDQISKEHVWKVARYTSAAPMYFSELDHYVDGGVMANNPCEYGLTAIQNYHRDIKKKLDIACVVSVGTGVYPEEGLGNTDAHKFLFFGKHWFNFEMLKKRATNLMTLLTTALLDSESVAINCMSRCKEQRIPFYRFSPTLETVIASGETDDHKLIEMLTRTKLEATNKWDKQIDELVQLFRTVADMSKKQKLLHLRHQRRARLL